MQVLDTGPDWIQRGNLRFNIEAKAENPASATASHHAAESAGGTLPDKVPPSHEEQGFALLVAKNGAKLRTSTSAEQKLTFIGPNGEELGKPVSRAIKVNARRHSLSGLKDLIAIVGEIGPGVDRTELAGVYDFTLSWNEEGPSLASALRDQLGLEVRREKVPVERFVPDSAQKPTAN